MFTDLDFAFEKKFPLSPPPCPALPLPPTSLSLFLSLIASSISLPLPLSLPTCRNATPPHLRRRSIHDPPSACTMTSTDGNE